MSHMCVVPLPRGERGEAAGPRERADCIASDSWLRPPVDGATAEPAVRGPPVRGGVSNVTSPPSASSARAGVGEPPSSSAPTTFSPVATADAGVAAGERLLIIALFALLADTNNHDKLPRLLPRLPLQPDLLFVQETLLVSAAAQKKLPAARPLYQSRRGGC